MQTAKSRGTWGKRVERTPAELNAIASAFFDALTLPKSWEFIGFSHVDDGDVRTSVGKVYRDKATKGIELMHYRVFFLTHAERGGICEKSIVDFGKHKYFTVNSNLTTEKLNDYIQEHYVCGSCE